MTEITAAASRLNSSKVVWVGCKLPHGMRLQLFSRPVERDNPNSPNAFKPPPVKSEIVLKGANSLTTEFSVRGLAPLRHEFAVTPVPAEFWAQWIAEHADHDALRNGFIFVVDRERDVKGAAAERDDERTGLEPLKPEMDGDPRIGSQKGLPPEKRIAPDAERLAALQRANGR